MMQSELEDANDARIKLRRATYHLKDAAGDLAAQVRSVSSDAERSIYRAQMALFEAWTLLCEQSEIDDDHG